MEIPNYQENYPRAQEFKLAKQRMRAVTHNALCFLPCPFTETFGSKTRENGIWINSCIDRLMDMLQSRLWNGDRQISNCIYEQYLLFMQLL